jgi:hypothetical protein
MQKSAVSGSQAGSGVTVIVGVTDGMIVAVGGEDGYVERGFVLITAVGGSATGAFEQDTRNPNKKFMSRFIKGAWKSFRLLSMLWSQTACRR